MNIHRVGAVDLINVPTPVTSGATTTAIAQGAPVASVAGKAVPASLFTFTTDEATTRTNFVAAFLGMSESRSRSASTDVRDQSIEVNMDGSYELDMKTGTAIVLGDYIGCDKAAGNALLDTFKKVTVRTEACFIAVEAMASTGTRVRARLINTLIRK
jgi:hypothetical protein